MPETSSSSSRRAQAPTQQQQDENQGFLAKYGGQIFQMFMIWLVMRLLTGGLFPNQQNNVPPPPSPGTGKDQTTVLNNVGTTMRDYAPHVPSSVFYYPQPEIPLNHLADSFAPLWPKDTKMDLSVYTNQDEYFTRYQDTPVWQATDIIYGGNSNDRREHHIDIPITKSLQHNGTLYAHIFVTPQGATINPKDPSFVANNVVYLRHTLTKFYPKKNIVKQKKLLGKDEKEEEMDVEVDEQMEDQQQDASGLGGFGMGLLSNLTRQAPLVAYWHENVTLSVITEGKAMIPKASMQPPVIKYIPFDENLVRDATGKVGYYKPIVFPNDFWLLRKNAYPVNETISSLPLTIHLEPLSMWKFSIYATMTEMMNNQQSSSPMGGMSSSETDEVKRMFLETNPILLAVTISVSLLHSLFEMLAFKNDIAFWKKKDNSTGVSVRSIIVNIFFQIVIFLYLLDNNQETSWMILMGQGVGLLIEVWKVFKALKYELIWRPGQLFPTLSTQNANNTTEEEDETSKYDAIAFKYLTWISYPLLAGYAVYSLLYDEHKSWYSFVLKTLVEFVYLFGFITMIPQLYINYRLKSVAHMPWRTLMYKSLNTFIDDLFAFVIKMPTLHRIACLRDDAVFIVYLYQRYKYKVDPTRANEYGQVGEQKQDADKKKSVESKKDQ
ncbi:cleft lip and palate transmembrane protein 1-domain-containing protein [Halteromyces radiatus]|uniref:cleft lip and palate transmembrane protein 1-domain-containing protein n=1 Tax=Halteromyces radiatus TaxID=101107 RepID=UPI002220C3A4|nr:cleft lip and palate transmembrane protein 1-domain-containing protein [Halteromyces radiatus]KAI8078706.1 cleft lip and palate transmembrane protein 1-domain-containing protein [Halteromyces radiatus]